MPEKNTPLASSELPSQLEEALNQPAIGRFPEFEKALELQGVTIPETWSVANFLSVSCVGTATEVRKDLGLPELEPQEVRLIYDDFFYGVIPTGGKEIVHGGYEGMSYEVIFPDNNNFEGSVHIPGYYVKWCWGLPRYCKKEGAYADTQKGYSDQELFDTEKGKFTPNGLRLVNFIRNTITADEKPPVNPIKPFGQMVRKVAGMSTTGYEYAAAKKLKEDIITATKLVSVLDLFDAALKGTDINPNSTEGIDFEELNKHLGLNPKEDSIQLIAGTCLQRMFTIYDEMQKESITSLSSLDIQAIRFVNWHHQHPM